MYCKNHDIPFGRSQLPQQKKKKKEPQIKLNRLLQFHEKISESQLLSGTSYFSSVFDIFSRHFAYNSEEIHRQKENVFKRKMCSTKNSKNVPFDVREGV